MSDDGGMRVGAGGGGGGGDEAKGVAAMGGIVNIIVKTFNLSVLTAFTFPQEVYYFFSEEKKQRYHWTKYFVWMIYMIAFIAIVQELTKFVFVSDWSGDSFVPVIGYFFLFGIAGFIAGLPLKMGEEMTEKGGWRSWHPGMGYIDKKTRDFVPMPWQKFLGWLPQLGPKSASEKLFSVSGSFNMTRNTQEKTVSAAAAGAAAAVTDFLPIPDYLPFALGPANAGETVLRGTRVMDGFAYRKKLEQEARDQKEGGLHAGLLTFGAVPMRWDAEPQHLGAFGKSGAGKTQAINAILRTARYKRSNASLIADPAGGYLARFWRPGDKVLNPFDSRTENWSPFSEMENPYDAAIIAKATIPDGGGESGEWNHYAQSLLTEVLLALKKKGEKNASSVLYFCATAPQNELATLLEGTTAAILTQKGNEKMLGNVRGIISTYMGSWKYLKNGGTFSVREFVRNSDDNGGAFLFMTYTDAQMAMLKFLIATWMELAIIEGLSLSESNSRRLWVILDELDSLGKISSLKAGLTKLRKYGVCCVCGIQTVAQLRGNYGRDDAQTLLSCMATKLVLSPGDNETADYVSKELGEQEIERVQVSSGTSQKTGFMVTDMDKNASKNESLHRQIQAAVLPSQLLALPNLQGYLRMPGTDVFQIVLNYVSMPDISRPYEPAKFD